MKIKAVIKNLAAWCGVFAMEAPLGSFSESVWWKLSKVLFGISK